jgi:hypothetical protein
VVNEPLFRPLAAMLSGFFSLGLYLHEQIRGVDTKLSTELGQLQSEMAADRAVASNNYLALQQMINEARTVSAQKNSDLSAMVDKLLEKFESNKRR